MIKKLRFIIVSVMFLLVSVASAQHKFKVVLDPGHGGKDFGAVRNGNIEKKIVLDVALRVGDLLSKDKNIEIIYTRKTDEFIELRRRGDIANEAKADLFVSIHANSHKKSEPYGTETFVMGKAKSEANLAVAKKENDVVVLEDDYKSSYAGFDINKPESLLVLSLVQEQYINQSIDLAGRIQTHFTNVLKRKNRGIKQAPFLVLHATYMPSVLIELGFVSHPEEGDYLSSDEGKEELSISIANAILEYKRKYSDTKTIDNYKLKGKPVAVKLQERTEEEKRRDEERKLAEEKARKEQEEREILAAQKELEEEQERIRREEAERKRAEKEEAERKKKEEAERKRVEKEEADRKKAEKEEAERKKKEEADRKKAEKEEADRKKAEKEEAERKKKEEKQNKILDVFEVTEEVVETPVDNSELEKQRIMKEKQEAEKRTKQLRDRERAAQERQRRVEEVEKKLKQKENDTVVSTTNQAEEPVYYAVQLASGKTKIDVSSKEFKGLEGVQVLQDEDKFIYYYGMSTDRAEVNKIKNDLKEKSIIGFVIKIQNGKKIK